MMQQDSGVFSVGVPVRDWVAYHGTRRPGSVAVHCIDTGESRTWSELDQRVGAVTGGLRDVLGVRAGDRVCLLAENDVRTFELHFACVRLGAIFVPLNWRLELTELLGIIDDCQPALLVHDEEHEKTARRMAAQRKVPLLSWDGPGTQSSGYEQLVRGAAFVSGGLLDPEAITQITYTSGTSGRPKGVMGANRTVLFHALNMAATSRFAEPNGHHLNVLPLFWAGGLNTFTSPMFYWGGRVTTTRRFSESVTLSLLSDPEAAVTHICAAPEMYFRVAALPEFAGAAFTTLRRALVGGWRPDTARLHALWRARGVFIQLAYGSTETGPNMTVLQDDDQDLIEARSCGTPVPYTLTRLVGPDGRDVPDGEVGEIWAAGPAITPGYWGRDKAEVFEGDWFRTGDLGRFGPRGDLYMVDRLREIIRSGGTNVYPAEIEQVLIGHPAVREVAVVAVPDARFGEVPLAVVVPEDGAQPTLEELDEFTRGRLARYKRPRHLVLTDELPRNASDKIERHVLRDRYAPLSKPDAGPVPGP